MTTKIAAKNMGIRNPNMTLKNKIAKRAITSNKSTNEKYLANRGLPKTKRYVNVGNADFYFVRFSQFLASDTIGDTSPFKRGEKGRMHKCHLVMMVGVWRSKSNCRENRTGLAAMM